MNDLAEEQRRIDEEIERCHKRKELEQAHFVSQLQTGKIFCARMNYINL